MDYITFSPKICTDKQIEKGNPAKKDESVGYQSTNFWLRFKFPYLLKHRGFKDNSVGGLFYCTVRYFQWKLIWCSWIIFYYLKRDWIQIPSSGTFCFSLAKFCPITIPLMCMEVSDAVYWIMWNHYSSYGHAKIICCISITFYYED